MSIKTYGLETFVVRPPLSKLFYALLISLGISFVGWQFEERSYQIVGVLVFAAFVILLIQFLFPRKIILAQDCMIIPSLLPLVQHKINFHSMNGYTISEFKGHKSIYFHMKNRKVYSVQIHSVEGWDELFSKIKPKVPESQAVMATPPSPTLMKYMALGVWLLAGLGVKYEVLDERTAIIVGVAATAFVVMGMLAGIKKRK